MSDLAGQSENMVMAVLKAIRYFKIPILHQSLSEQLRSHPDYPSLKAVTDTLDFYHIQHQALRINADELRQINEPFLAYTFLQNDELQFVEKRLEEGTIMIGNRKGVKSMSAEEFGKIFSGAAIFLNPSVNSGEPEYKAKKRKKQFTNILPAIVLVALLLLIIQGFSRIDSLWTKQLILMSLTKTVGLVITALLLIKDLNPGISALNQICHVGSQFSCSKVTNHPSARIFNWVKWSDLGLIYFMFGLLLLSMSTTYLPVVQLLTLLALPFLLYSIYMQAFVIKSWCPLCLAVLAILALDFILALPIPFAVNFETIFSALTCFLIVAGTGLWIKYLYQEHRIWQLQKVAFKKIKRTPGVLENLLQKEQRIELTINDRSLLFGSLEGYVNRLSVFLSLDCPHCAKTFTELIGLMEEHTGIQIHIIPVIRNNHEEVSFTLKLYRSYHSISPKENISLLAQWYDGKYKPEDGQSLDPTEEEKAILKENALLVIKNQVAGFPAVFLNDYKLPAAYRPGDLSSLRGRITATQVTENQLETIV